MSKNLFQSALLSAISMGRAIKKADLGKDSFEAWEKLAQSVFPLAYEVKCLQDAAIGKPESMIDKDAISAARTALAKALRPVVALVGEVAFVDGVNAALLEVNPYMLDAVADISVKWDWNRSEEVRAIEDEISDANGKLGVANKWAAYYAMGNNEQAKAKYAEEIAALEGRIAALKVTKKAAEDKPNGKVRCWLPHAENDRGVSPAFRQQLETAFGEIIGKREKESYEEYQKRVHLKNAKRKARAAENRKAKKDIEKKMAEVATK